MRPSLRASIALLTAATLAHAAETEWPEFRGPTGQGLSRATNVPTRWSATENIAWKVSVPGRGWSSPVLSKGRIYLTTAVSEGDVTLRALCFDAKDGRILWDTEVFTPNPGATRAMHRKNSLASPTPIVTADRLFVHFSHLGTAALDLDGKVVWRQNSLQYEPVHGTGGSPILVNDSLVFGCDGAKDPFLVALDAATGEVRWKSPRTNPIAKTFSFATPLAIRIGDATQIISPTSGFVAAYNPADGSEIWRARYGDGYSVVPRPVFAHGLIFVSSSFDRPVLKAVRPEGASGDATDTHTAWDATRGAPSTVSPIVVGDELYYISDGGIATCADARTGKVHWTQRLSGNFSASPILAEGRLYFFNESGVCTIIKAGTTFEVIATNDLGDPTLASPAPADNTLYIRSEHHLWKIESK